MLLGSALSMDKVRTKQVWLALGLPTPRYASLSVCATAVEVRKAVEMLGFPVIIKPAKEGSSVGVSRVFALEHLEEAVALAARYEGELLMEQLIEGDELTVSILDEMALPSIRIVPQGQWYDYNAKYLAEDTQYVCPGLDDVAEAEIAQLALAAFHGVGCRGWGRVDVMRERSSWALFLIGSQYCSWDDDSLVSAEGSESVGYGF